MNKRKRRLIKIRHVSLTSGALIVHLLKRFVQEGLLYRAASLAYASLLTLVPIMIVSFAILQAIPYFQGLEDKIQQIIFANFVASSADVVLRSIQKFMSRVGTLSITNIVFLIIVSVLMIFNMSRAMNAIWHTQRKRNVFLTFIIYLFFVVVTPLLIGSAIAITSYLVSLPFLSTVTSESAVRKGALFVLPYGLSFVSFTLLNWILPSCKVRLKHAALGGLVTTILFEIAKYGFAVYLAHVRTYRLLYGALAILPLFLIWLYVVWVVVLFGVLVAHYAAKGITLVKHVQVDSKNIRLQDLRKMKK